MKESETYFQQLKLYYVEFEKMMLLIYCERDVVHLKRDFVFFGFTFSKMEQMVDFANELDQYCTREDFLDYRNIPVLIFVINEVFHCKLEQDHQLVVQELLKEKSRRFDQSFLDELLGDIPTHCSMTGP